jgi:SAM-dependent methyltransferase
LTFDPRTKKFALPPEHAAVLAAEGGPLFLSGFHQQFVAMAKVYEPVAKAFREGGGVSPDAYDNDMWEGQERSTTMWHDNLLVQEWIPKFPAIKRKLEAGADLADVGSGSGRALVRLAQAFPKSRFIGFDLHAPSVERARALARSEGVADRVRFEVRDVTTALPGAFDIVTAFDVIHDTADPPGALKAIHKALRPHSSFLLLEINTADKLEENAGPFATAFFGVSIFYCMTIALSKGGVGFGTAGLPEGRVREEAKRAGFSQVVKVDINNPLNNLFELKA